MSALSRHFSPATLIKLALSWGVVAVFMVWGAGWLHDPIDPLVAAICFLVIFATILVAAFGVVQQADYLAHQLGEPYGTLILTLSIVSIEVILIAAVLLGPGENATIGRDSIFAVMMIIMNLVMGLCLLLGGRRFSEQDYNAQGTSAYLGMTLLLAGIGLVLPNYLSTGNGTFHPGQAVAFAILTIGLYIGFLVMQTGSHRRFFVQPAPGSLTIPAETRTVTTASAASRGPLDRRAIATRVLLLVALMLPIVLLAHDLALIVDFGIDRVGAPVALGGVLIAIIVFTPESITAVKAALANQLQRSVNLCLGAFVSTVGLTIPAVLTVGLVTGKTVIMGISAVETLILLLTLGLTALTFSGQRASALHGVLHLALFAVFGVLLFGA